MKDKRNKGITLIALVVTIIVLLILAGISIAMLTGNNGILQKATDAKTNSEKQGIIEQARIDVLGQQAENKGTNITKEQLVTILNKYFEATDSTSIPDEISSEHDVELTTIVEKYKINLSEIFKGKFANENNETTIIFRLYRGSNPDPTYEEYEAQEGMTWREWITAYCPENFSEGSANYVQYQIEHYRYLLKAPGSDVPSVYMDNEIIKDGVYGLFYLD